MTALAALIGAVVGGAAVWLASRHSGSNAVVDDDRRRALQDAVARERRRTLEVEMQSLALLAMREQLEEANADLRALASSIGHDVAVPARTIAGLAELADEALADGDVAGAREDLAAIGRVVERMRSLLGDITEVVRIGSDAEPAVDIDPSEVIAGIVADLGIAEERVVVEAPLPNVHAGRLQVRQILQNLVQNGLRYNRADTPMVSVSGVTDGTMALLEVRDNGIGIPDGEHESIFELFNRGTATGGVPGSGAGLAIVRRACRAAGGDVWLEDTGAGGSTFVVALPAAAPRDVASSPLLAGRAR